MTNEKRNLSEHVEKNFKWKKFLWYIEFFSRFDNFVYLSGWHCLKNDTKNTNGDENQLFLIIFRHKKWRNHKTRALKGHNFYKAQFKCATSRIIISRKAQLTGHWVWSPGLCRLRKLTAWSWTVKKNLELLWPLEIMSFKFNPYFWDVNGRITIVLLCVIE